MGCWRECWTSFPRHASAISGFIATRQRWFRWSTYLKLPEDVAERFAIVVDPMLATGHSAIAAVHRVKQAGVRQISFACLLAAPEGLNLLAEEHPDIAIYAAALDRQLDEHGYIRPGLGDAGDRLFGTK